jgi:hypothetical protein
MSKKTETPTLLVTLHIRKTTPKSWKGTRAAYVKRVTEIAMRDVKSGLLVRSSVKLAR